MMDAASMERATGKLLELASAPFLPAGTVPVLNRIEKLGNIGKSLWQLLSRKNGFFCFEQALRIFPISTSDISWGIQEWNESLLWKADYNGLADNLFCFGEDIFGNQLCLTEAGVATFNVETGEIETVSKNLEDWASKLLLDYDFMTGYRFAHEWQEVHGLLPSRYRLMPKRPFILGGEYELANFVAMDSVRLMKTMGNLARQISDLPDGSRIQFKIQPQV